MGSAKGKLPPLQTPASFGEGSHLGYSTVESSMECKRANVTLSIFWEILGQEDSLHRGSNLSERVQETLSLLLVIKK
jgi:hypothetical protein